MTWGRSVLGRVAEFTDDLNGCSLAAFRSDLRGAYEIDALLLVQRPKNDLELGVGKDARDGQNGRCRSKGSTEKQSIDRVHADRGCTRSIAGRERS